MSGINMWCKLVVYVSMISAIVMLIIPENSLKKVFQTLMTVILIFSLMHPLSNNDGIYVNFNDFFTLQDKNEIKNELANYKNMPIVNSVQSETEKYLNEKMKSSGVDAVCNVVCSVKDNTVYVDKVTVETHIDEGDKKHILTVIREICTNESEIIINGEKYE